MPEPTLSEAQASALARYKTKLAPKGHPPEVEAFLLALRECQLLAELNQKQLAERAAVLDGPVTPGRAKVGHDADGNYSRRRMSEELYARDGLPRAVIVQAVAEAYAHRWPQASVHARLTRLRKDAVAADAARRSNQKEAALRRGQRHPTYTDLAEVRGERDAATADRDAIAAQRDAVRRELEDAREQLADMQGRYHELAQINNDRTRASLALEHRVTALLTKLETLEAKRARADRALERDAERIRELEADNADLRRRNDELDRSATGLRAQIDQLHAEAEALRRQLNQSLDVREDPGPDSSALALTWDESSETVLRTGPGHDSPAPPGLVTGIQDQERVRTVVYAMLNNPEVATTRVKEATQLPRDVRRHIAAVALAEGRLLPQRRTHWESQFSCTGGFGLWLIVLFATHAMVLGGAFADWGNQTLTTDRWLFVLTALGMAYITALVPFARRLFLSGTLIMFVAASGLLLGTLQAGPGFTTVDVLFVAGLSVAVTISAAALGLARQEELWLDEIVDYRKRDPRTPTRALRQLLKTGGTVPSAARQPVSRTRPRG